MLETTFPKKLLALALGLIAGGLVAAGCVDNSGNKTYPRGDSGTADAGDDVAVSEDTGASNDAPAAQDAPPADAPAADKPAADGAASDGLKLDVSLPVDTGRLDLGIGG
jgi:hypothetical protein